MTFRHHEVLEHAAFLTLAIVCGLIGKAAHG